jgi:hypothetical protein
MGHIGEQPQGPVYSLTSAGRKQRGRETSEWKRLSAAIGRILESEEA